MPRSLVRLFAVCMVAALLAACGAPTTAPPQPTAAAPATGAPKPTEAPKPTATLQPTPVPPTQAPKALVIAKSEDTVSLDPGRAFEILPSIIHKATYQTLVTFPDDSANEIRPLLAKKWDISPDGKQYTFTLRGDAKFNDGTPVTAKDVVFSWMRLKNIKGNPSSLAANISRVEAKDEHTVVLTLENADPSILSQLVNTSFSVVNSEAVKKQGGTDAPDADKTDKAKQWLNQHSEGSGPYLIEKWEPKVETVLVRNPDYWGKPPAIERVVIRNIADAATQKLQLEAGDVDIALDLTADQMPSLQSNPKVRAYQARGDVVFFLLMNQDKTIGGPLSDPKVQQAVRLALDYEGIKQLLGGQAATPPSIIPIGFFGAYGEDKALKRDVEGAKKLLAEAGFGQGFDVDLRYPDFTFSGFNFATTAQKIQADLAEVGVTVNLKGSEVGVWLDEYRQGKQRFSLSLWGPDFRDPGNYLEFMPERKVGLRANWANANSDKTIQALRDKASVETDPAERAKLFAAIQDYLQQNGPFAPVVQSGVQIGLNSALQGFVFNPQWVVDVALLSK